jgi:hypothetical protein
MPPFFMFRWFGFVGNVLSVAYTIMGKFVVVQLISFFTNRNLTTTVLAISYCLGIK